MLALLGFFPPNFANPSSIAASTALCTALIVLVSDFGINTDTLYLSLLPLIETGSHPLKYENLVPKQI